MKIKQVLLVLLLFQGTSLLAQQNLFSGKIQDADTEWPLLAANIQIKDTRIGAIADEQGQFTLSIPMLPAEIIISYIGYETYTFLLEEIPDEPLAIKLKSIAENLEEIVVVSTVTSKPISDRETYSVVDFEVMDDRIVRLEYHGVFKKYQLALVDLNGMYLHLLPLKGYRFIEGLYQSCHNNSFLLTEKIAYQLSLEGDEIKIESEHKKKVFNAYVKACHTANDQYSYYVFERMNGLEKLLERYDNTTGETITFHVVAEADRINNMMEDINWIVYGKKSINVGDINDLENDYIRNAQAESDFLSRVFYRPDLPIYLYSVEQDLVLFNHTQGKIEYFDQEGNWEHVREIDYQKDKSWEKQLIFDQTGKMVYGLFDHRKGFILKQIDPYSGQITLSGLIEEVYIEKIQIVDEVAYYIAKPITGGNKGMLKIDL